MEKTKVVNVKTKEQWDIVSRRLGYHWYGAEWSDYGSDSCIEIEDNYYGSYDFFKTEGFKILSFEKWLKKEEKKSRKENKKQTFEELQTKVIQWGKDKNILSPNNQLKQFAKTVSELGELGDAIIKDEKENVIDAIGDVFVCMTILSEQLGLNPIECFETAYNVISKRTGKTENGVFIKD